MKQESTISNILKISKILSRKNKFRVLFLVLMMFVSGIAEILTLGSVYPFLAAIINPNILFDDPIFGRFLEYFDLTSASNFIALMSLVFCSAVVLSSSIRVFITWLNYKWSYELAADLVIDNFKSSLYDDYLTHIARNSSEMISAISHKTSNLVGALILPSLTLIQLSILSTSILSGLIILLPTYYLLIIIMLGVCYLSLALLVRRKLVRTSEIISSNQIKTIKVLQESLDGIKEIILGNYYEKFIDEFSAAERPYRKGYGTNAFLIIFPRFLIEAIGILVIVSLAYLSFSSAEVPASTLPTIGILVLAIQRLLPYLQQVYQAYGSIKGSAQLNTEAIEMLVKGYEKQPVLKTEVSNIQFKKSIELNQVNFKYESEKEMTLKNISLKIMKGERIGIIGSTGSGKSTLVNFIMGLLPFKEGEILIDGLPINKDSLFSWYKKILHVPQTIFLADTTIRKNIAFGEDEQQISDNKIRDSLKSAYLDDYINKLPDGIETRVGERGLQLSGGQRQRIGIARSLYKGGEILILDEATNALDMETEKNIVKTINSLDEEITLIIIAHNLSTIEGCDRLIVMDNGKIQEEGNYEEIIKTPGFQKISGHFM